VGFLASAALVGMAIGTLLSGLLTDIFGRRKLLIICMIWFSVCMIACAVAPSSLVFAMFRLLSGIGLGGVFPTAIALTVEFAPRRQRNFFSAAIHSGYPVGSIIATLLGMAVLQTQGFRPMYAFAAIMLVTVLPVTILFLPESVQYLIAKGRMDEAEKVARKFDMTWPPQAPPAAEAAEQARGMSAIRDKRHLGRIIAFGVAALVGQLLIYGLSTWLPQIMRTAGYPLGSALHFLILVSIGAIVGAMIMSWIADRYGARPVVFVGFLIGAIALLILATNPPYLLLQVCVVLAGVGANGTATIINGYVAVSFPDRIRASAIGFVMTIGRIGGITGPVVGGVIAELNGGIQWFFFLFMIPAVIGVVVVFFLPRTAVHSRQDDASLSPVGGDPA
jgi:AAHS family benzoate transporter-like MFS transporter